MNKEWLNLNQGQLYSYLRDKDIPFEFWNEYFSSFYADPLSAYAIIQDFYMKNQDKIDLLLNDIVSLKHAIISVLGNQRKGKGTLSSFFLYLIKLSLNDHVRIVSLGNFPLFDKITKKKKSLFPFISIDDYYFSINSCPTGNKNEIVIIYCSEMDIYFPARESASEENKSLNIQINTFLQKKQILWGEAKLASNVDISVWRNCHLKFFKYITKDKLIYGERDNFISPLLMKFLPDDANDLSLVGCVCEDNFYSFTYEMPDFYSDEIGTQYNDVSEDNLKDYIISRFEMGVSLRELIKEVRVRFRFKRDLKFYSDLLGIEIKQASYSV